MKKEKFVKDLTMLGTRVQHEPFSLSGIISEHDGHCYIKVVDNSGSIIASIPVSLAESFGIKNLDDGAVLCLSGVLMMDGKDKVIAVSELAMCDDFIPAELFAGITKEEKTSCKAGINDIKCRLNHPGYKALVDACLTDTVLERMSELPATLNMYGKYNGASLITTNAVSHMVMSAMASYTNRGNSFSTAAPDWNALMTASLLFLYGNIQFFTPQPPYKRTKVGVAMGYMSLLQKMIEDVIHQKNILLSDEDIASLINILKVSMEDKTGVRATSKEGAILRHMLSLYIDCEAFDWEAATHEESVGAEGYYYSQRLKGYVIPAGEVTR